MDSKVIKRGFGLLTVFFTAAFSLQAQPDLEWANNFGNNGSTYSYDVAVDNSGNAYVCGYFNGTGDFDPGPGTITLNTAGDNDIYIAKFDPSGTILWIKSLGSANFDAAYDMDLDPSGNPVVCGNFWNTVDFDPGPGVFNLTTGNPSTATDAFVLKLDSDGNFIWAKNFVSSTSSYSVLYAVGVDDSGNILLHGHFNGTVDFDPGAGTSSLTSTGTIADGYLVKLNSDGDFVYAKQFSGLVSYVAEDLVIDSDGDIIITGQFSNSIDADPNAGTTTLSSAGSNDVFLIKLTNTGDLVWAKSFGGTLADYGNSLAVDLNNNIILLGHFNGTVDFDPGPGVNSMTSFGNSDIYLTKFDTDGNFQWCDRFGGTSADAGLGVCTDADGNIYSTGYFNLTCDFDPGAGVNNITSNGSNDLYLMKTTPAGIVDWVNRHGGTLADTGYALDVDQIGNILTVGTFQSTVDFDPGVGVVNLTATGINNSFIQKLSQCSNDVTPPVASSISLADINSQCSVISLTAPTATDNCAGTITGTHNASLPITTPGTTVITWTYDDGNGNTITQNQNVIIDDNTAPVANVASLADINAQCSVTSLTAPTATDNCAGTITGTHNASLPITTPGTTVITWTYDDGNGNSITQNQNVIIDDNTAPVANSASLADINAQCSVTSLTAPTATDNCAGTITGTHNASLPITTPGTTVITWTYEDGNGNSITQNQNVIIDDNTAPVADVASLADINAQCSVTSLTAPTATDNCAGTITGTHNATLPITTPGTTVVTWTYEDGNGNTSTQDQLVIITPIDNGVTQVDALTLSADASGYSYQWINCANGNSPISGAASQTFVALANGSYAVTISNGTCSVTSDCIVINSVSVHENELTFKVYPNPADDQITIVSDVVPDKIEIYNAQYELMSVTNSCYTQTIIILPEASGIYFVRITVNNSIENFTVSKN